MRTLFLFLLILVASGLAAQHVQEKYFTDIHDALRYESSDGRKATLSKNIFDDWIYSDNQDNKFTYTKDYLNKALGLNNDRFRNNLFRDLIESYRNTNKFTEKYSVDIFEALQYESNDGYRASLSKDIFDNKVFKDNRGNELKTSKEFTDMIRTKYGRGGRHHNKRQTDADWFKILVFENVERTNAKEEYTVDIFGNLNYKNSVMGSASLKKDIFDAYTYSDSKGNKIVMSKEIAAGEIGRSVNLQSFFINMVNRYLSD